MTAMIEYEIQRFGRRGGVCGNCVAFSNSLRLPRDHEIVLMFRAGAGQ